MEHREEHFVIKIKTKAEMVSYWTDSLKEHTNTTTNFSRAKKYKSYDEAVAKATQISQQNNVMTWVVKVETVVSTTEVECIVPEKLGYKKDAFWDYMTSVDKKSDFFREMMDMGSEYFNAGKNPDKYLNEIIDNVKKKLNMK